MAEWQVTDWNLLCLRADGLEVLCFGSRASLHVHSLCQGPAPGRQPSATRQTLWSVVVVTVS